MGLELEVKILDIDVKTEEQKILALGGSFVKSVSQQLYTYDLPSLYGRFKEIISQLNSPMHKFDTDLVRLRNLFFELDNLDSSPVFPFFSEYGIKHYEDILLHPEWKGLINFPEFHAYLHQFNVNPNKWIRLRKSNDVVTLAVKHILAKNQESFLQQMLETEIQVSSFEETNNLLSNLGFSFKSYQEKRRNIYELNHHEIDFDFWPGIPPYIEFEGTSEEDLNMLLNLLGFSRDKAISCTADAVYELYGKSMFTSKMLKFENNAAEC